MKSWNVPIQFELSKFVSFLKLLYGQGGQGTKYTLEKRSNHLKNATIRDPSR